ncbi:uncharacterized protein LOC123564408 [Mercenaria mercenaria]|uniref:uncharacterized protein LOC123564408 n=1 Tax=Mercenaria mercenaria TaxID=6596 RepID=UPI00234F9314|nr:uncharacterized protein LOC123564408 [Mercenaria mercenaria]
MTRMYFMLVTSIFTLVFTGTSQAQALTSEQILSRITDLEIKDREQSVINAKLLEMVAEQREQLVRKELTLQQLLKQVHRLKQQESTVQDLLTQVTNLKSTVAILKTTIASLASKGEENVREDTETMSTTGKENKLLLRKTAENQDNKATDKADTQKINQRNVQVPLSPFDLVNTNTSGLVAFHAVTDYQQLFNLSLNQNIVFETVLLNLASAYDNNRGVFVAPTNGLYLFSTSVLSYDRDKVIYVDLVKSGTVLASMQGHGDQTSVTAVTQLNAADEVSVRLFCCTVNSVYGKRYTSFNGLLLKAL